MLETKNRRISDVLMVVSMANDEGIVVVVAVVLQGKRQGEVYHHQKCLQGCLRRMQRASALN